MTIIKIEQNANGSHIGWTINKGPTFTIPEGFAVVPDKDGLPENFPFGDITVADVDGVPTVTSWSPLPMPEPVPEPPQERRYTADDLLGALLGLEEIGSGGGGNSNLVTIRLPGGVRLVLPVSALRGWDHAV